VVVQPACAAHRVVVPLLVRPVCRHHPLHLPPCCPAGARLARVQFRRVVRQRAARAATNAALSVPPPRSRTTRTISPVPMFSAPCSTRRALRPLITTTCCAPRPRRPQGGELAQDRLIAQPDRPARRQHRRGQRAPPPPFCRVRRIGTAQYVFRSLPAPAALRRGARRPSTGGVSAAISSRAWSRRQGRTRRSRAAAAANCSRSSVVSVTCLWASFVRPSAYPV
jgi:hypothetical protein